MPSNITPTNAWTTPLTGPANGDSVAGGPGGASYDMGQKLANRVEFLKERVVPTITSDPYYWPMSPMPQTAANWLAKAHSAGAFGLVQDISAAPENFVLSLDGHIKNGVLREIHVTVIAEAGHAAFPGGKPATMPTLTLLRQDPGLSSGPTVVATFVDASASAGVYEAIHDLSITGLSETFTHDGGQRHYLMVAGEGGANNIPGLAVLNVRGYFDPA